MKVLRTVVVVATGAFLAVLSQKAFAQDVTNATVTPQAVSSEKAKDVIQDTRDIRQDKKDIVDDTKEIQAEVKEIATDTTQVKADRQALRDAIKSGDKAKIKATRETLHKDLKERRADIKDLNKDKRDRRKDIKDLNRDRRDRRRDLRGRKGN